METSHIQDMFLMANHRGTAVRVRQVDGEEEEIVLFEAPYPAYRWHWKEILAYAWKSEDRTTRLEAQSALVFLRRMSKDPQMRGTRFLLIMDSQAAAAALAKGRSSSTRMNRILRRAAAVSVAGDMYFLVVWCVSDWNFSDRASRRFERKAR